MCIYYGQGGGIRTPNLPRWPLQTCEPRVLYPIELPPDLVGRTIGGGANRSAAIRHCAASIARSSFGTFAMFGGEGGSVMTDDWRRLKMPLPSDAN